MLRSTLECTQTTRRDTAPTLYGAVSKAPGEKTPRKAPPYHPHGRTEVGGLCPVRRVPRWCHSAGIATKGSVTRKGPAWPQAVGNPLSGQANQRQRWSVGSACRTCRRVAHHAATSFRCKNTHNVPRERPKRGLGACRGMQVLCTTGHPKNRVVVASGPFNTSFFWVLITDSRLTRLVAP